MPDPVSSTGPDLPEHAPANPIATSSNAAPDPTQKSDNATRTIDAPRALIDPEPIPTPSTSSIPNNTEDNNQRRPRAAAKNNKYINQPNEADDGLGSSENFTKKAGQAGRRKGRKRS